MFNNKRIFVPMLVAGAFLAQASAGQAATVTDTFQSRIVIQAECVILSTNTLDFGTHGVLTANVDNTADFNVQCTNSTPYNVDLDGGTGTGTIANRTMENGGAVVNYNLYTDSPGGTLWGNGTTGSRVAGTGNGASQTLTVHGRVPAQTTPAPGTYTDTVTITVEY